MWEEKLKMDMAASLIYKNGGTQVSGFGVVSEGWGGGLEMEEACALMEIQGVIQGMYILDRIDLIDEFFKIVGERLLADPEKYPLTDAQKKELEEKYMKKVCTE